MKELINSRIKDVMNFQNGNINDVIHATAPTNINRIIFTNIFETLLKKTSLLPILFEDLF